MMLFFAPRSPFAVKVRILVGELNLWDAVVMMEADPWTDESLRLANPLCKVPTLVLSDGAAIYDSPVICEYLNRCGSGNMLPSEGPERWSVLRRQALADGLSDAIIRRVVEQLGPLHDRARTVVLRQEAAITAALDAIEGEAADLPPRVDIGWIAVASALLYLSYRSPEIVWREGRAALSLWFDAFCRRPSVIAATSVPGGLPLPGMP